MNPVARAVAAALLAFVWQGAVVGAALSAALAVLTRRSANARYAACCAAMAVLAMLPLVTAWLVYSRAGGPDSAAEFMLIGIAPDLGGGVFAALQPWAMPVWLCGVGLSSVRFIAGWRHVNRLRRSVAQASSMTMEVLAGIEQCLDLRGRARLALATLADGPVVIGVWRPIILLPIAAAVELTREQLEAVLAHEAAHVRRHDYAVNVGQAVVETLLFYHPVTWWVSARMRHERELCCDDAAVAVSGNPVTYARGLVKLEHLRLSRPALALGATGTGGALSTRIRRILGLESRATGWPAMALTLLAFTLLACIGSSIDAPRADSRVTRGAAVADASTFVVRAVAEDPTAAIASTLGARVDEPVVGRRLARIQVSESSPELRQHIALSVRIGDTITATTRAQVDASLKRVDGHLGAAIVALPGGQAAIVISRTSRN